MQGAPTQLRTRAREGVAVAAILAVTLLVYLPSLDGPFVLDDHLLLRDPLVTGPLAGARAWIASPRPLATATFALDFALFGLAPRGWHLTSLAIHLAAILLVWRLAARLIARAGLEPRGAAVAVAALFALHPLQTEAVAYVVQRSEAIASALYVAGLLLLLAREEEARPSWRALLLAGAALLHALGVLAKPVASTMPIAWLLLVATLPAPAEAAAPAWRRALRRLPAVAPLLAISVLAAASSIQQVAGSAHAGFDMPDVSVRQYLATQLRAIPTYLRLLAWPRGQCVDWSFPLSGGLLEPGPIAGGLFLAGLTGGAIWLARRAAGPGLAPAARLGAFGTLFFLVALLPSSSVIPLHDPIAERRVYLASLGLFLPAVAGFAAALRRLPAGRARAIAGGVGVAVLAALAAATAQRSAVWASPLTVYRDALRQAPGKAVMHSNLGLELLAANRDAEAVASLRRGLELAGDRTVGRTVVLQDLVAVLVGMGRIDEALAETRRAILATSGQPVAFALDGYVRMHGDDPEGGEREIRFALEQAPGDPQVLALHAFAAYQRDRDADAIASASEAVARDPDSRLGLRYLGLASARAGDLVTARDALRRAERLGRGDGVLLLQLGSVEAQLGETERACGHLGRALAVPGKPFVAAVAAAERARIGCR